MARTPNEKIVEFNGIQVKVYSSHALCRALHRTIWALRKWEKKGIVPRPILTLPDGFRWYTEEELQAYVNIFREEHVRNGVSFAKNNFSVRLRAEIQQVRAKYEAMLS